MDSYPDFNQSSSRVWQRCCRVKYLFFTSDGLAWSTMCVSVSMLRLKVEKGEASVQQPWSDLGSFSTGRGFHLLLWWSDSSLAIWCEGPAKGPYQKNTPLPVRLEPMIYRLQVQAIYQLSYPGPRTQTTGSKYGYITGLYPQSGSTLKVHSD